MTTIIDDLSTRLSEAIRNSPLQDLEKNMKVVLTGFFDRLDLVQREDFEIQRQLLERANARLLELEARITALEAQTQSRSGP